jgi:hypothetical protein
MPGRVDEELALLRGRYPGLCFYPQGNWVSIPSYPLPQGWNRQTTDVAFQVVLPPAAPYGIYVPAGILFQGQRPGNYTEPAPNVGVPGIWGIFSWQPVEGEWRPATTAAAGSNYLNWVVGFSERFREGA